jgi:hypothetical protein
VEEQSVTTREIAGMLPRHPAVSGGIENIAQSSSVSTEIARDIADVNSHQTISRKAVHRLI